MAELARAEDPANTGRPSEGATAGRIGEPVPPPSAQFRTVQGGRLFQADVPGNWQAISANSSIKYVPPNGYGTVGNGQTVFTHGVELGVSRASSRDLNDATQSLIVAFARSNPDLRQAGDPREIQMAQRRALAVPLLNRSALGGTERIGVYTTFLADGNLFYYATIVPDREADQYRLVFDRIGRSIRLRDAR
jgi:hypothetical protein